MAPNLISPGALVPLGIYRRVSEDKALKGSDSAWREVEEQVVIQDGKLRTLAASLPFGTILHDYCDNNTPASDPYVVRVHFERMLRDLEAGVIRGILFLHSDRLARLTYDAARVCRIFEMNPTYTGLSAEGGVNLATVEGRGMFIMQVAVGNMEIGNNKRRVAGTNKHIAEKGIMHGAPRAFGWNEDRRTLHVEEAPMIRDAILAIPGGYLIADFRRALRDYGYEPTKTKRSRTDQPRMIQHSAAEHILMSPRVCGLRFHVPEDVRRQAEGRLWLPDFIVHKDGEPVRGDWEAPASYSEWLAAVNEIKRRKQSNKSGKKGKHDTTAVYLASGIVRCGKCASPMWSNPYSKKTNPGAYEKWGFRYACLSNQGGCGGVTRVGPPIDDLIETAFLLETKATIGNDVAAPTEIDETVHDGRLAEIAAEIADVNSRRREKRISTSSALDMIEELEAERDDLASKRGALSLQKRKAALLTPDALAGWKGLTMAEKRTRLKAAIRAVIVHPAGRGRRFDPDLIEIVWQENRAA
ncbi:recombinase family protein [Kitasatospora sp. NPDC059646]|uniref:recombinase family protein n=1 Tax=Kitasatospora sp. NPDC059646 TaxID=3346893 RepID=UPI0036816BCD